MRHDSTYGWILTKDEFVSCGFTGNQYSKERQRGNICTIDKMAPRFQEVVRQRMANHMENHGSLMIDAKIMGSDMTDIAVRVTADTLTVNEPYIQAEIEDYINKHYGTYTPHYLMRNITGSSVLGYAKMCAFGMWLHSRVMTIYAKYEEGKDRNKMVRSLRANILTALPGIRFGVKVPTNDIRFNEWMNEVVGGLNSGKTIEEIVTVKRAGNTNQSRLTAEQKSIALYWWVRGNSMTVKQLHEKMIEIGRMNGWWREADSSYRPVSYGTINTLILENKNRLAIERNGLMSYRNERAAQFLRSYPTKKNMAWGIDGTAHDENVFLNGKVMQYAYVVRIYDYATFRLMDTNVSIGVSEPAELVIGTIERAIRECGYKPTLIQCDKGPAFEQMKVWCEEQGIHVLPTATGRARAKVIEQFLGQMGNLVNRYLPGWTGQNRTALGENSKPSDRFFNTGKSSARTFAQASEWLRGECMEQWNNHIIETFEGRKLGKTPIELWQEKESDTPVLPFLELARMVGIKRTAQLTTSGVAIQHDCEKYLYFPSIKTDAQRKAADEALASIPVGNKEGSQVDMYILEWGKPVAVFKGDRYLGVWDLKKRIPMFAAFEEGTDMTDYNNMRDFQSLQETNAKAFVAEVKQEISRLPIADQVEAIGGEALTGKIRKSTGRYDKAELNAAEILEKAGQCTVDAVAELGQVMEQEAMFEWREMVDESTGEVIRVKVLRK